MKEESTACSHKLTKKEQKGQQEQQELPEFGEASKHRSGHSLINFDRYLYESKVLMNRNT